MRRPPLDCDILGNRENPPREPRSQPREPGVVSRRLSGVSAAQALYPLLDLAHHEHTQKELRFLHRLEPRLDPGVRPGLAHLGKDVGIEKEAHSLTLRALRRSRWIRSRPRSGARPKIFLEAPARPLEAAVCLGRDDDHGFAPVTRHELWSLLEGLANHLTEPLLGFLKLPGHAGLLSRLSRSYTVEPSLTRAGTCRLTGRAAWPGGGLLPSQEEVDHRVDVHGGDVAARAR